MSLKSSTKTDVNTTELVISIDAEAFEAAVEKEYQRQKKNIQIKGFRKGKVSRKLAEKTFGEGAFYEGAINALVGPEVDAAVKETGLVLVDRPNVEVTSIDKAEGVELKAICITKPEIEISDYKGIKAAKVVKEITDEDIDKQIEIIRKKNARIVSVEDRAAQMDDEVIIDFEGFFGDEAFEGGKGEDHPLKLGSGAFIPGFEDQIVGHSIGDEFDVVVTFPEDYQMAEYAGKEATFKTKLEEAAVSQADSAFENDIMNALIEKVDAPIPNCMFEHRIDSLMRNFEQQLRSQGMDLKLYFQYTGMDVDSFRETYRDRAEKEVKLRLALEKIAELENIEPSEEDVNAGLSEIAAANKIDVDTVKKLIPLDDYVEDMRVQKTVEFIKENAVVDNTLAEKAEDKADAE